MTIDRLIYVGCVLALSIGFGYVYGAVLLAAAQ